MGADQNLDVDALAASSFDWWHEAGLESFVAEAPRAWLAELAPPAAPGEPRVERSVPAAPAPAPAALPDTLAAFDAWRTGPDAPDHGWSPARIGAQGDATSGLMILTDMPERDDSDTGVLMSGAVGRLFDRMLAAIRRDRGGIYVAALAVARPVSGRVPPEAIDELGRIARHQLGLVAPKRLLVIGNAASRAILGADVAQTRGKLHDINHKGGTSGVVASYHPRVLLDRPATKADAWRDLQLLMRGIDA